MTEARLLTIDEAIAFVVTDLQQLISRKRQLDYGHQIIARRQCAFPLERISCGYSTGYLRDGKSVFNSK